MKVGTVQDCTFTEPVTIQVEGFAPGPGLPQRLRAAWLAIRGRPLAAGLVITGCVFRAPLTKEGETK